ncbi:hypothetical protein ACWD9K_33640 [Streptomyces sp. 900116325]
MHCRPVSESVRDTAAWLFFGPGGFDGAFGEYRTIGAAKTLAPEREQALSRW